MGKEKLLEKTTCNLMDKSNILMQYAPLIVGLISLIVCYLLFKKIQTLNSQSESISKIEKQFVNFIKEQSQLNEINSKKFNGVISQLNYINNLVQNSQSPGVKDVRPNVGPSVGPNVGPSVEKDNETNMRPMVNERELLPSSIQTNFPISPNSQTLPAPISTSGKKENMIDKTDINKVPIVNNKMHNNIDDKLTNRKIIDLQDKKEVIIEEVSEEEE